MDLVNKARELGKMVQADTRYIAVQINRQACDEDEGLQKAIADFNLKKIEINEEAQKEDRNEDRIKALNQEFRQVYGDILKNENMTRYNEAKGELDAYVKRITGIISLCAEGEEPETCDYDPASCGGNCNGCSGCG